jgi:MFS family permease
MTGLFIFIERRAVDPMLSLHFFKNRTFTVSVLSMFLLAAGMFGAIIYLPLFVQEVIGTSATNSGLVLTPMMLSLVVASTSSGQIISRTGRYKWAVVGGLALMVAGMALLSAMDVHATNGIAVRNMIVLGLGIGLTLPTLTLVVQNAFPPSEIGVVTAAVQFFRSIGATIGVALMGTLLTQRMTDNMKANLTPDVVRGVPPQLLQSMNPQVLGSPEARDKVIAAFARLPNGAALFDKVEGIVRVALANAMHEVFLVGTVLAIISVAIGLFLPETPLRKKNTAEEHEAAASAAGQPRVRISQQPETGGNYD